MLHYPKSKIRARGEYGEAHGCLDADLVLANLPKVLADEALVDCGDYRKSVVAKHYKDKYATRGNPRGCNDWMHRTLAALTLDDNDKLIVSAFEALLDANGVKHAHWNRTTNGWQGRLRMSGGMALRTVVAKNGGLTTADGDFIEAPVAFCDKHIH